MSLLARFRRRNVPPPPPTDPNCVNYTPEHVALAKTIARRQKLFRIFWRNISKIQRTAYLQNAFSAAGLYTGNTTIATYAHVTPPRATGMETIIVSANWLSRDGSENLRGIAMLLALGDFLRGRYRIDSLTIYCTPATGPHGFHTLGRTLESTLRSFNNLLERLHASYFFYLLPFPDHFIPVGNYLPAAVLLGASLTVGGLDCPAPEEGGLGK
ncbi:hypothetical protein L804_04296 [Cryptococcus deuterogattii 2001/935-1]|nr:hypothetical protein L804_04296 [Cryptococcus deuterogattii 2001/935-1]